MNNQPPLTTNEANGQANVTIAMNDEAVEAAASVAVEVGTTRAKQMTGHMQEELNEATKTQADQHARPPPPPICIKLMNWFPIRLFAFIGGFALLIACIIDTIFSSSGFNQMLIRFFLVLFALVIIVIESPHFKLMRMRSLQLKLFFWHRTLSRMWGRAWFYMFVAILCFEGYTDSAIFTAVVGTYLFLISIASFVFSKLAASKYNRMFIFIAAGAEGDELDAKLSTKYDELADSTSEGKVGSIEITKLATEAGRELSNAERHAVQAFLDESCNGYIVKEDWMKQFGLLKTQKQRFL